MKDYLAPCRKYNTWKKKKKKKNARWLKLAKKKIKCIKLRILFLFISYKVGFGAMF